MVGKDKDKESTSKKDNNETESLLANSTNASAPGTNLARRPYHLTPSFWDSTAINSTDSERSTTRYGAGGGIGTRSTTEDPWLTRANYSRYLYYNRLRRNAVPETEDILLIPPHVIPNDFFIPLPKYESSDGKQSSVITIFALWNTMMGTSLLSMPWALQHAGVIPGVLLLVLMSSVSFYTAYRILQVFEAYQSSTVTDFAVLCKRLLGSWAQVIAVVFSALVLLGATIVYWVLMSNFLYHTVDFIHANYFGDPSSSSLDGNFTPVLFPNTAYCPSQANTSGDIPETDEFHQVWDLYRTVPLFLIAILGPLSCVQSPTFFTKFNSLGTLAVLFLMVFVFVKGSEFGVNLNFDDPTSPAFAELYTENFPALAGMLSLAFFIHNCVLNIMKNNRRPEKNKRDLSIAFVFVSLTYFFIGGMFYTIFPLEKSCIEDNFLNNFRPFDTWTFTARIVLFFQMVTVFPLLLYILRIQVVYAVTKKEPTLLQVVLLSAFFIGICVCFAIWMPRIGTIIRFTGALCGVVYLFFLPILLYFKWQSNMGTLSKASVVFHLLLLGLGLLNFALQFTVTD